MRIQNNITAMNTHRMYTINNDNVAKSAEKLSSGYRINRAGDDAAGLAISEKMRSQIRGLNMATKNSQDAISLVQTAEGALQETHSMLQRMNELAVQAATGTNETLDRTALAKEFEQLKREINDVAEQTNFNNMKILDGSLSYEGYVRSAATAGVNNTITGESGTNPISEIFQGADAGATGAAGLHTVDVAEISGNAGTYNIKTGDSLQLKVEVGGRTYYGEPGTVKTASLTDAGLTDIISATGGLGAAGPLTLTARDDDGNAIDTIKVTTVANGSGWKLEGSGATPNFDIDWNDAKVSIVVHTTEGAETVDHEVELQTTLNAAAAGNEKPTVKDRAPAGATSVNTFDLSKVSYGDTMTIGGQTFEIVKEGGKASGTNVAVEWNGKTTSDSDLVKNLSAAINNDATASAKATATVSEDGKSLILKSKTTPTKDTGTNAATWEPEVEAANAEVKIQYGSGNEYKGRTNTIEFDIAKMKDGDTFTITSGDKKVEVTFNSTMDRQAFMDEVDKKATAAGLGYVKGNALIVKDAKIDSIELKDGKLDETNAIRIQVGANEHEMLSISIDSMNTAGLGLDDAALTKVGNSINQDQDLAGKAITAVKNAINKVSDQRATLGAMQNRLDHKIANLKVSSENLSAAESRIRDVDMASEMTNFTKNNILSQAATAMLAQANSLPQNVLSLLG